MSTKKQSIQDARSWGLAESGMSLRDYFAAAALQGMLASEMVKSDRTGQSLRELLSVESYLFADAMLAARERK